MKRLAGVMPLLALLGAMPAFGAAPIIRSTVQTPSHTGANSPVALSIEDRLQLIERRMQALTDILMRLDRIQQEMQQLRGDTEMQAHALESLKKRQRDLYGDIDRRMMQLTGKRPSVTTQPRAVPGRTVPLGGVQTVMPSGTTAVPPLTSPSGTASPSVSQVVTPNKDDISVKDISIPSSVAPVTIAKPAPMVDAAPEAIAASVSEVDAETAVVATPVAPPADPALEQPIYKQAFDLLMQRRYDEAKQAFRAFLRQYPNGRLAANAQYWVGEASYVTRDFVTALGEFTKVVQNFPASPKVSDSLLKIAFIQYEQKEWAKARETLETVIKQHATTTAARLARKRLERMRIEGN